MTIRSRLRAVASFTALATMWALFAVPGTAGAATTLTFTPTDDATVRESRPTNNYGGNATLEVDASSRKDILLRFDVSGVGGSNVESATLRVYAVDSSPVGGTFTKTLDTTWSEANVTWNTAPAGNGGVVGSLGSVSSNAWYEVDLTSLVQGDGPVSVRVTSTSANGADYVSKEGTSGNTPVLEVVLDTPPVPDFEAPTAPQNLAVDNVFPTSVSLSWDASTDNIGVVGYDIERDGVSIAQTGTSTSYTDATVDPDSTYQYVVRARDAAGTVSASSNQVSATTPAASATTFDVTRDGSTYHAVSLGSSFSGSLKFVVESALDELDAMGGGSIVFAAGDFDLGSDHFEIIDITDVTFVGAGMGATIIRNFTNASADTEPFDATRSDRLTIRDLTVSAGGSDRTTSDALDFDGGDDILIERVEVIDSRGRGIIFDGKDSVSVTGGTADRNVVRDCVITNVPRDGIQLLASNSNTIEGCHITNVGAEGIRVHKASSSAGQPNKPSNDNIITGNFIQGAADNGIAVTSGNRNTLIGNTLLDNGADGISVHTSVSSLGCDDNLIDQNTASGNRYGLNIEDPQCNRTVVGDNQFAGNSSASINDNGTDTIYTSSDTEPPSVPGNLIATDVESSSVSLSWDPSTDNVGVAGYDVIRDGTTIAQIGPSTSYQDTSVAPETSYSYEVRARDASGNVSDPSNSVAATTPPGPAIITLMPTDDATIKERSPGSNYGAQTTLEVDASSRKDALLRFDVTGIGGKTVAEARLRLYVVDSSSSGGTFTAMTSTAWSEDSVTWANAPVGVGAVLGSLGSVSSGQWYEIDVTTLVTGDGPVAIRAESSSSNGVDYASKEDASGRGPELVVTLNP